MKYQKHQYIRSKELLENARKIPCQWCGADDGTIVAAHSNELIHGKGRSVKADDNRIASLCYSCHTELDQGAMMSKDERRGMWRIAHWKTVDLLVEQNLWPQNVPIPKG